MGCDDEKLSKYLTHTFMAHCHTMICQQVTLSGAAEWPKVADAVIEATNLIWQRASIQSFILFAQPQAAWADALFREEFAPSATHDHSS